MAYTQVLLGPEMERYKKHTFGILVSNHYPVMYTVRIMKLNRVSLEGLGIW